MEIEKQRGIAYARFAQQVAIAETVGVVEKAGQPIVAALNDVLRDVGQVESGLASHGRILDAPHVIGIGSITDEAVGKLRTLA